MACMVVIYKAPKDKAAFDRHYFETHIPLAKKLPGLKKYEVSTGPLASPNGSGADTYLVGMLHFDDMAAIRAAFASPEGQVCAADRRNFAPDDSQVQMLLFDSREV